MVRAGLILGIISAFFVFQNTENSYAANVKTSRFLADDRDREEISDQIENSVRMAVLEAGNARKKDAEEKEQKRKEEQQKEIEKIREEIVSYACQFIGGPYVYGGSSLTNGIDCSGFVMRIYEAFGVRLPHSSAQQSRMGTAVEGGLAQAKPGDVIVYPGHVGIYIGDNKIVHASTERTGITISNAQYREITGIRRMI